MIDGERLEEAALRSDAVMRVIAKATEYIIWSVAAGVGLEEDAKDRKVAMKSLKVG